MQGILKTPAKNSNLFACFILENARLIIMKTFLLAAALLLPAAPQAWAQDEIVIEMTGDASAAPAATTMWDYSAVQLTRRLRGKTREQVLYDAPVVSDKDRIVRGAGKEYALVEYYSGRDFRKFLFKAESPQTFVAAAANAADVLAVNKKYGLNIGLPRKAFENFYEGQISAEGEGVLPQSARLYKLFYRDINTPSPFNRWFLFEKDELTCTFETEADKNAYLDKLQKQNEAAAEARRQAQEKTVSGAQNQNRTVRKALISGGTAWDQANLPRVVNPRLIPTPTLKKSSD